MWQELHDPLLAIGLNVSSITTRSEALLSKQFFWAVAQEGEAQAHWAYWVGLLLQDYLLTWLRGSMPLWSLCPGGAWPRSSQRSFGLTRWPQMLWGS